MAAYRQVYDSRRLQAESQEMGSAPEPNARQSSIGNLYLFTTVICSLRHELRTFTAMPRSTQPRIPSQSLNRVLASAVVRTGMSPLPGGR